MSLKISYNQECHRLPHLPDSLKTLFTIIQSSFDNLPDNWSLQYLDSDGDLLSIKTSQDLETLLQEVQKTNHSIKVYVTASSKSNRTSYITPVIQPAQVERIPFNHSRQTGDKLIHPKHQKIDTYEEVNEDAGIEEKFVEFETIPSIQSLIEEFRTEALLHDIAQKALEEHIMSQKSLIENLTLDSLQPKEIEVKKENDNIDEKGAQLSYFPEKEIPKEEIEKVSRKFERPDVEIQDEIVDSDKLSFPEMPATQEEKKIIQEIPKREPSDVSPEEESPKLAVGQHEDELPEEEEEETIQEKEQQKIGRRVQIGPEPESESAKKEEQNQQQSAEPQRDIYEPTPENEVHVGKNQIEEGSLESKEKVTNIEETELSQKDLGEKKSVFHRAKKLLKKLVQKDLSEESKNKVKAKLDELEIKLREEEKDDLRSRVKMLAAKGKQKRDFKKEMMSNLFVELLDQNMDRIVREVKKQLPPSQPTLLEVSIKLLQKFDGMEEEKKNKINQELGGLLNEMKNLLHPPERITEGTLDENDKMRRIHLNLMRFGKRKKSSSKEERKIQRNEDMKLFFRADRLKQIFPHDDPEVIEDFVWAHPEAPINALLERYMNEKYE